MSAKLEYLPAAESFLDPDRADAGDPGAARAVVIPFGLEASVSYGGGTAAGPAAILKASQRAGERQADNLPASRAGAGAGSRGRHQPTVEPQLGDPARAACIDRGRIQEAPRRRLEEV